VKFGMETEHEHGRDLEQLCQSNKCNLQKISVAASSSGKWK